MKKVLLTSAILGFTTFCFTALAQEEKLELKERKEQKEKKESKERKETQEIVIRKKGEKDTKMTVEIKGDKITINGKPLSEFKDDEITINKRNIIIRDGKGNMRYNIAPGDIEGFSFFNDANDEPRAFLGVTTEDVENGAKIKLVNKESAAEKAGLKAGDIITKVGDKKVDGPETLSEAISAMKPKDEVKVYYTRDGKENTATVVLGERKDSNAMAYSFSGPDGMARSFRQMQDGANRNMKKYKELEEMSPKIWNPGSGDNYEFFNEGFPRHQKLGLKIQDTEDGKGVKVLDVDKDSPAEKAGLKKDDIVTEIGDKKVSNTDEAREQLMDSMEKSAYSIKANRNGNAMNFDIKIPKKLKTANL